MKKLSFLTILLAASSVSAEMLHIQCQVFGLPVDAQITDSSENIPYQDIVKGDFSVDTEEVFARPDFLELIRQHNETDFQLTKKNLSCSAFGVKKSRLFGEPKGTQIQIAAFQCGFQTVVEMTVRADRSKGNPSQSSPSSGINSTLTMNCHSGTKNHYQWIANIKPGDTH